MIRYLLIATFIFLMASCSSTRPINSATSNKSTSKPTQANKPSDTKKNDIKFLDEISSNPGLAASIPEAKTEQKTTAEPAVNRTTNTAATGDVSALKIKYAGLLGKDPDQIENVELLKSVDEWYG